MRILPYSPPLGGQPPSCLSPVDMLADRYFTRRASILRQVLVPIHKLLHRGQIHAGLRYAIHRAMQRIHRVRRGTVVHKPLSPSAGSLNAEGSGAKDASFLTAKLYRSFHHAVTSVNSWCLLCVLLPPYHPYLHARSDCGDLPKNFKDVPGAGFENYQCNQFPAPGSLRDRMIASLIMVRERLGI